MFESKVKKQALVYGVIAVFLVTLLTAFAYRFGALDTGTTTPPTPVPAPSSPLLPTFTSYEALRDFLMLNSKTQGFFMFYSPVDVAQLRGAVEGFDEVYAQNSPSLIGDYSETNIQVAGVDEADFVKTDGEYIYVLSENRLLIVRAYPPETADVMANVSLRDLYPAGMFVSGDRLVVLGSKYFVPETFYRNPYMIDIKTFAHIYDIHNKTNPELLYDIVLTGSYFNSRMIGDYVYYVVSQPAYIVYDTVILPKIYSNDQLIKEIVPSEIHYYNASDNYYQYTTFVALNMQNATEAPTYMTLMLGGTSSMYVSQSNMYITFSEFNGNTTIYRVRILGNNMTAEAKGQVSGNVLNQFSMDEYNGYFRIATETRVNGVPRSNLFVLDMDLQKVGELRDIEVGEVLDSARFMGDRCYLSTSVVRKDPFFVIDVSNASKPAILGYLKIPGFTRYLHPYDENHVIGVGRDESNYVRVSLFDVSNVSAPKNMSEYKFDGVWSDTTVLWDHKAFLFAPTKNLLAIPVSIYKMDYSETIQGLFVFNITLTDGLVLRGNVTHQEAGVNGWDSSYYIERALYIENMLYTISGRKIKLNNLEDLAFLKEIPLS